MWESRRCQTDTRDIFESTKCAMRQFRSFCAERANNKKPFSPDERLVPASSNPETDPPLEAAPPAPLPPLEASASVPRPRIRAYSHLCTNFFFNPYSALLPHVVLSDSTL